MTTSEYLESYAAFSPCGKYRYALIRRWSEGPIAMWIGANPSTADADMDDHTLRRSVHFTKAAATQEGPLAGVGAIVLANTLAFVSTDPTRLLLALDPVGPENDWYLEQWAKDAAAIVVCWGQIPDRARVSAVVSLLTRAGKPLLCLGTGGKGAPLHPARLANDTHIVPWRRIS